MVLPYASAAVSMYDDGPPRNQCVQVEGKRGPRDESFGTLKSLLPVRVEERSLISMLAAPIRDTWHAPGPISFRKMTVLCGRDVDADAEARSSPLVDGRGRAATD